MEYSTLDCEPRFENHVRQYVLLCLFLRSALKTFLMRWFRCFLIYMRTNMGALDSRYLRLTNIRYADDLMIFAASASELREMLELFHDELDAVGVEIHSGKSKIMILINNLNVDSLTIRGLNLTIFPRETPHLYLGRLVTLSPNRYSIKISNRIRAA